MDPDLNVGDVVAVSAELITSHFPEENVIEVEAEDETENDKDDCCDPPPWVTTGKAEAAVQLLKVFTLQHDLDDTIIRSMEKLVAQHCTGAIRQSR